MACLLQSALALRPKDSNLAVLAANAYVAAHDYNRAMDHYNRWACATGGRYLQAGHRLLAQVDCTADTARGSTRNQL